MSGKLFTAPATGAGHQLPQAWLVDGAVAAAQARDLGLLAVGADDCTSSSART
jgi:hypothetical protein